MSPRPVLRVGAAILLLPLTLLSSVSAAEEVRVRKVEGTLPKEGATIYTGGCGVVVGKRHILTNRHLVQDSKGRLYDGFHVSLGADRDIAKHVDARVVFLCEDYDLALLETASDMPFEGLTILDGLPPVGLEVTGLRLPNLDDLLEQNLTWLGLEGAVKRDPTASELSYDVSEAHFVAWIKSLLAPDEKRRDEANRDAGGALSADQRESLDRWLASAVADRFLRSLAQLVMDDRCGDEQLFNALIINGVNKVIESVFSDSGFSLDGADPRGAELQRLTSADIARLPDQELLLLIWLSFAFDDDIDEFRKEPTLWSLFVVLVPSLHQELRAKLAARPQQLARIKSAVRSVLSMTWTGQPVTGKNSGVLMGIDVGHWESGGAESRLTALAVPGSAVSGFLRASGVTRDLTFIQSVETAADQESPPPEDGVYWGTTKMGQRGRSCRIGVRSRREKAPCRPA